MRRVLVCLLAAIFVFVSLESFAKRLSYSQRLCKSGLFECAKVKRGVTWESMFPDPYQRNLVKSLNRVNMPLKSWMRIAVPKDLDFVDKLDLAPFEPYREPTNRKVIVFDPKNLAWGAYDEEGVLVNWGAASGGKGWCPDVGRSCRTVVGDYYVFRKQGSECKSTEFPIEEPGAPMPYCMHFYRGYAIHGSSFVPGYNASHGCIRVFEGDARWLNEQFIDLPGSGRRPTTVITMPYI